MLPMQCVCGSGGLGCFQCSVCLIVVLWGAPSAVCVCGSGGLGCSQCSVCVV